MMPIADTAHTMPYAMINKGVFESDKTHSDFTQLRKFTIIFVFLKFLLYQI